MSMFSAKKISILMMFEHSYKCVEMKINSDRYETQVKMGGYR